MSELRSTPNIPTVESLNLEQKVSQVLCLGWQEDSTGGAASLNSHAQSLVQEMHAGAVVLLGRNISSPKTTRLMISELQELSAIPLLIAIDQEGGSVNRIREPFHEFPGNMALGAIAYGSGLAVAEDHTQR